MTKIFNNAKHGWMSIAINDDLWPASYIDDVTYNVLTACEQYLENKSAVICFDAEGWDWNLVLTDYNVYVIEEKNDHILHYYDIEPDKFIEQMYDEIKKNLEDFVRWQILEEDDYEDSLKEYKDLIAEIEALYAKKSQ